MNYLREFFRSALVSFRQRPTLARLVILELTDDPLLSLRDLLRGCEKSVRKRHQGMFFSESQGVSLEVDFRWYGKSLTAC